MGEIQRAPMTTDEARALYESISPRLRLVFRSYYKYSFSFCGEVDGITVGMSKGGSSDAIYKMEVDTEPFDAPTTWANITEDYSFVWLRTEDREYAVA